MYALDNPIKNIDPDGRFVVFTLFVAACIVAAFDEYGNTPTVEGDIYEKSSGERFLDGIEAAGYVSAGVTGATAVKGLRGAWGKPNYSSISDHASVGEGKPFTQSKKAAYRELNRQYNNGKLRSDQSGTKLVEPKKHVKGQTPPSNEAHVDHIVPKSKGGTNSGSNAQIISRAENLTKSNTRPRVEQ